MHQALHSRNDIDRLYAKRKEGERGLASIEDRFNTSIRLLENQYKGQHDNNISKTKMRRKNNVWISQINEISHEKTWTWQRKGKSKREDESLLIATGNNAIRTICVKEKIDKT